MCHETLEEICNIKGVYVWICVFILIPINWIKEMKKLSYVSMIANVAIIFACTKIPLKFLVMIIITYDMKEFEEGEKKKISVLNLELLPFFFGVAVFNFEGNGVVLNV
jgi:amino acid permease